MWVYVITSSMVIGAHISFCQTNIEAVVGSSVTLSCSSKTDISWNIPYEGAVVSTKSYIRNEQKPEDLKNRVYTADNRLTIVNVQQGDAGTYSCVSGNTVQNSYVLSLPALVETSTSSYFRSLYVDNLSNKLLVGSMNRITTIDLATNKMNHKDILPKQTNVNTCKLSHPETPNCQNHIKILAHKTDDILIVCGTNGYTPTEYEFSISNGTLTEKGSVPCSNDPFHNFTTTYSYSNNPNNYSHMYYGSVSYTDKTIQRPNYNTDGTIKDYIKGVDSTNWMKEPQFVGSFDMNDTVLMFFREEAVEVDPTEPKIYSRVAKVCKKDIGGNSQLRNKWTSYQKARLSCSIPSTYPAYFDVIQDVVTTDGSMFYGLFTTGSNLKDSAICGFRLTEIEQTFQSQFKHQPSTGSYWVAETTVLSPRPGQCVDNSLSLPDETLEFIANKPLMYDSVQPVDGKPLLVLEREELQVLELHKSSSDLVFYAASNRGNVYKLFAKDNKYYILTNYSSVPGLSSSNNVIWDMQQKDDKLFLGTDRKVQVIQVINCEQHRWIDTCVKDPHCVWINNTAIIPQDLNNVCNKCLSFSFAKENGYLNMDGVFSHENYDISSNNPINCFDSKGPWNLRSTTVTTSSIDIKWIAPSQTSFSFVILIKEFSASDYIRHYPATDIDNVYEMSLTGLKAGCPYHITVTLAVLVQNKPIPFDEIILVSTDKCQDKFCDENELVVVIALSVIVSILSIVTAIIVMYAVWYCKKNISIAPSKDNEPNSRTMPLKKIDNRKNGILPPIQSKDDKTDITQGIIYSLVTDTEMPKGKRNEPRVQQAPKRQPIRRRRGPAAQDAEEAPNGTIAVQEPAVPVQLVHVPVPNPMVIQQNMTAAPPMPQNPNENIPGCPTEDSDSNSTASHSIFKQNGNTKNGTLPPIISKDNNPVYKEPHEEQGQKPDREINTEPGGKKKKPSVLKKQSKQKTSQSNTTPTNKDDKEKTFAKEHVNKTTDDTKF